MNYFEPGKLIDLNMFTQVQSQKKRREKVQDTLLATRGEKRRGEKEEKRKGRHRGGSRQERKEENQEQVKTNMSFKKNKS